MNDTIRYALYALVAALVLHRLALLALDPAAYTQRATLSAVRRAFRRAADIKESSELLPYSYYIHWPHFWNIYAVRLRTNAPARFVQLRSAWGVDEIAYRHEVLGEWKTMGDSASGLSGSLFFRSQPQGHFLLKSLNREFEVRFLHEHFLRSYFDFALANPKSLINKIMDVLCSFERRAWGVTPSNYLVLENIAADKGDGWEMFDLKPTTYLEVSMSPS